MTKQLELFPKVKHQSDRDDLIRFWITEIESGIYDNDFQWDFFESVSSFYQKCGRLSEKQFEALRRIYERVTR